MIDNLISTLIIVVPALLLIITLVAIRRDAVKHRRALRLQRARDAKIFKSNLKATENL